MARRKEISKKLRFEVFKRDSFTCQYCGRMAPDVILEVDHIKPVSAGGTNELLNLITSCRDCNRGKGKALLSDNDVVKKCQSELKELNEKREQVEMMMRWKDELSSIDDQMIDQIDKLFYPFSNRPLTQFGRMKILSLIKKYSFELVYKSTETAIEEYFTGTLDSLIVAASHIEGICYYDTLQQKYPFAKDINYFSKILSGKFPEYNRRSFIFFIRDKYTKNDFDIVKSLCVNSCTLEEFWYELECLYGDD